MPINIYIYIYTKIIEDCIYAMINFKNIPYMYIMHVVTPHAMFVSNISINLK